MTLTFNRDEEGLRLCAVYVAQLIREQVTFKMCSDNISIEVTLTGGF